jgi:hypothetical protein
LFHIIGDTQTRPRPNKSVEPYIAAGAPFTEPLSNGSFFTEKIFSVLMLLPPVNPKDPLGVAVKAWLPTKLLAEVGVAGFTVVGINALPAATVASIVQYHIIPGRSITSAGIPTTFPNVQMPTAFIIPAPNTNPLVRFTSFPSKRGANVWVNNIPVVTPDLAAANGTVHVTFAMLNPPTRVLLDTISRDADLTYLVAAITAADAGVPAGSKFSDFLANAAANKFAGTLSALIPPSEVTADTQYPSFIGFQITNLYEFFMLFIVMTGIAAAILFVLIKQLQKMMNTPAAS